MSDCFPIAARSPSSTQPINAQSSSRERFSCSTYFPAPATQTVIFQFPSPFYLQCTDQSGLRFWFFKTAIGHLTWDFPSATKGSKPDIAITKIEIMKKIAGSPVSTIVNFQYRFIFFPSSKISHSLLKKGKVSLSSSSCRVENLPVFNCL